MERMNEDQYWAIVDASLKTSADQDEQRTILIDALKQLPPEDIIGFYLTTCQLLNDTYTSEMWCAGTIMNTRCSDDGFEDFRCWVVSRGKDVYYKAKANPDSLISELVEGRELYEFESFGYVAMEAFEESTGKDLLDTLDEETETETEANPETTPEPFTPIEFNWQRSDPESMKKICPQLYQQFKK